MLVSLRWLRECCDFPDNDTLINDLNRIGFEVENVIKKGDELSNIVIGHIQSFEPHPDADRLRIAQVDIGQSEVTQIVTAATNVSVGDKIPVSLPGATLASGLKIKKSKLRGVPSNGMMCSAVECGLTDTAAGVWVLPENSPVGVDFIEYAQLVDTVIDICILPNRGDAMSLLGLAREVSALYKTTIKYAVASSKGDNQPSNIRLDIDDAICRYYRAQGIFGITNRESDVCWQTRLYYSGYRPLSWIIDITNIVMIETGQPLHAFDGTDISSIEVSYATKNPTVELLNEKSYTLTDVIPVIKVNQTIAAVAGVMGANKHSVTKSTTSIVLEAALFDPVIVRKASKQCGVRSESSARFEKGVDIESLDIATNRVIELLGQDGSLTLTTPIQVGNNVPKAHEIQYKLDQINEFLGTAFNQNDVTNLLTPLGFTVSATAIRVPSWRVNDCQEWPDIAEELCRFSGIADVKSQPINEMVPVNHDSRWRLRNQLNQIAISRGLTEVIPFPLLETDQMPDQPTVLNPITPELTTLRSNGIQSLLKVAHLNVSRHSEPSRIFSIGPVWTTDQQEVWQLTALIQGSTHYQPFLKNQQHDVTFFDLKGCLDSFLDSFHLNYSLKRSLNSAFHPGQSADIIHDSNIIGHIGILHPDLKDEYRLPLTGIIQFDMAPLLSTSTHHHYSLISKYPSTTRDTTYIMDKTVDVGDVISILNREKPQLCINVVMCGFFQKDKSSDINISFRMTYQDQNDSLEMEYVNKIHKEFAEEVINKLPCRFP